MKIQFNTDVHIDGKEAPAAQVGTTVEQALEQAVAGAASAFAPCAVPNRQVVPC